MCTSNGRASWRATAGRPYRKSHVVRPPDRNKPAGEMKSCPMRRDQAGTRTLVISPRRGARICSASSVTTAMVSPARPTHPTAAPVRQDEETGFAASVVAGLSSPLPPNRSEPQMSPRLPRPTITDQEALEFHASGRPGKLEIIPTKPMATQRDLSLAYSPGVAVPVRGNRRGSRKLAYDYTTRGNMVAVISNGTAILGLGNLGALASKPVMEGKAVLFKRFADVDSIDLEVDTEDVDEFINCVRYLGPVVRRHQPRGHQGAGLLHHRAAAARTDGHPGLPRRPARHGDHRRRRPDQRARPHRPRHRDDQARRATARARPASPASS